MTEISNKAVMIWIKDNNQIAKSLYYAGKSIVNSIAGVVKDPVGFLVKLVKG